MLAGCGASQTANQAESESTEENLVLMEETLPQTAPDETVMALSPDGPLLPSVAGVDAEYSEPIPDYLRIGEKHPIVLKLQQRLMDLGFMDNDEPTDYYGVAWPAQNMPVEFFGSSYPWSISMGKDVDKSAVKVTLIRQSDQKKWAFSEKKADGYFNVENSLSLIHI